jgi:hypothetical protein
MHAILGLLVVVAATGALARLARGAGSGYRRGPWPGLSGRGAGVLLVGSCMLFGIELGVGGPHQAWPELFWLGVLGVVPLLVGTCVVRAPGCASAVCGVYLMGRSLATLVEPRLELPPLLLPAAVALDMAVWLRRADLRWPVRRVWWRRRKRVERGMTIWRAAWGGVAFGVVLSLVEPPFAVLMGGDPARWAAEQVGLAGGLAALGCAVAGAGIEAITSALRGRPEIGRGSHPD